MVRALPKRVSYGFAPRFVRQLQLGCCCGLRQCPGAATVFAVSFAPETIGVTAGGTGNITNEGGSSPHLASAREGRPGRTECTTYSDRSHGRDLFVSTGVAG